MATYNKQISSNVYRERFFSGIPFVKIVAKLLSSEGFEVKTPDQKPRKIRANYSDRGDVHILKDGKTRFILEVKSRRINFTGIEDYPYNRVFIDNCNQWDHKKHRVAAVIIISQTTEKMIVVPVSTRKYWKKEEITDSEKQVRVWKYSIHKIHCITIEKLIEKLKEKLASSD